MIQASGQIYRDAGFECYVKCYVLRFKIYVLRNSEPRFARIVKGRIKALWVNTHKSPLGEYAIRNTQYAICNTQSGTLWVNTQYAIRVIGAEIMSQPPKQEHDKNGSNYYSWSAGTQFKKC